MNYDEVRFLSEIFLFYSFVFIVNLIKKYVDQGFLLHVSFQVRDKKVLFYLSHDNNDFES